MSTIIYVAVLFCWCNLHMSLVQGPIVPETIPSVSSTTSNHLKNISEEVRNPVFSKQMNPRNEIIRKKTTKTTKKYTTPTTLSPEEVYKKKIAAQRRFIENNWCKFLKHLYEELRKYEYQYDPKNYNVADLKDWGNGINSQQGLKINRSNINSFLELREINDLHEDIKNWNSSLLTGKMFQDLNNVIDLTIGMAPHVYCDGIKLVITRPILVLHHVTSAMKNTTCSNETQIIELFASDVIYMTQGIDLTDKNVILAIMAPRWDFVYHETITIDLSGSSPPEQMDQPKAKKGETGRPGDPDSGTGRRGYDGKPGAPANHSGSFLGLGEVFIRGESLTILANGGNGQAGQDGGDGGDGKRGEDANLDEETYNCTSENYIVVVEIKCFGMEGLPGGNGGQAGAGGNFGLAGNVTIISINNITAPFKIESVDGKAGPDGKPGEGGRGGQNGLDKTCLQTIWKYNHKDSKDITRAADGKKDTTLNKENMTAIEKLPLKLEDYSGEIINDYKSYLEDNLINNYTRARDLDLLLRLFKNDEITIKNYKLVHLIDEFLLLEKHFHHLYDKVNLLPLYEEIQQHIDKTAKAKQNDSDNEEITKVLNHLFTSTQSKICMYHESASGKFIANIESFLNMFMENVKLLREYQEEEAISNANQEYKDEIDKQIKESEDLISNDLLPRIKRYTKEIRESVDELLAQIPEMLRELKRKRDKIRKAIEDLKKCLVLNIISSVLEVTAVVANFIPGVGQAISAGLAISSTVLEAGAGMYDRDEGEFDLSDVDTNVGQQKMEAFNMLTTLDETQVEKFMKQMNTTTDKVIETLTDSTNGVGKLCARVEMCRTFLNNKDPTKLKEIMRELEKQGKEIFKTAGEGFEKLMTGLKTVRGKVAPLVKAVSNGMHRVASTRNKLDTAEKSLKQIDNQIKGLESFKKNIKNVLFPVVKSLSEEMDKLVAELRKQSASGLEVKRLKIKEKLKEVKAVLLHFTANFSVEGKVKSAMNGILNTIDPMINIFQKIENYKDQKKMADFTTKINSAKFRGIQVKDPKIADRLLKLKINLQSNIIFLDYQHSMNQLKQLVFPLGKYYFEKITVPAFLERSLVSSNNENFLFSAINEIETYKKNLVRSKVFVTKYDKLKHRKAFYSGLIFGKPFYVWRSQLFSDSISSLLAGEEVYFYPVLDDHFENAIKFNYIHLRFKVLLYQNKLDKALNNFMVVMTHMGNSHYRCANKSYVIITESQQFRFTFEEYKNKPVDTNMVFERISNGDFLLSPFATWKFQLITANKTNFKLLSEFRRYADLELVGAGEYYEDDPELCPKDLHVLYDLYNITQNEDNVICPNDCHNCSVTFKEN